ncbi:MAG: hypothetical protein Q9190_006736, partial [Brigantiaea leucoxantha]
MKRKFSLSSLRLKFTSSVPEQNISPEGLDSPPYSPTPSEMERPAYSAQAIADLRVACAIIVNETNPPDYEEVPDPREMLRRYKAEREAQAARAQARADRHERHERHERHDHHGRHERHERHKRHSDSQHRKHRNESSEQNSKPRNYRHVPQNAASDFRATTNAHRASASNNSNIPKIEPCETAPKRASRDQENSAIDPDDPIEKIRAALDSRPKTSAAACIDYSGPSNESTGSSPRSTTSGDEFGRPSTGLTSLAMTPGDDKRVSYTSGQIHEQINNEGPLSSLADATARAWMAQELERRRAEYQNSGKAARPGSRATYRPQSVRSDRPISRSGSITGSVIDSVRGYIKPRISTDSQQSRSELDLSRAPSRSDSTRSSGGKAWSKVKGLRKKNSWSSFRSAKPEPQEEQSTAPDGGPNLNRALPALPGLDQYKEKKPKPAHIAQLMYSGRSKSEHLPAQHPQTGAVVASPKGLTRNLSTPDDQTAQARQQELRRAVEEKMRMGAIAQQQHLQPHPLIQGNSFYSAPSGKFYAMSSANMSAITAPTTHSVTVLEPQEMPRKKPGLRKRM